MRIITNAKQNICFVKIVVSQIDHGFDSKEEDPVSEDSKKTLSLKILKRIFSMRNLQRTLIIGKPIDNAVSQDPRSFRTLNDFCATI